MTPKEQNYKNTAETIIKNLQKRQMQGFYCATKKDAVEKALSLMPQGSTVGWGGSMTLSEVGLMESLQNANLTLFKREEAKTKEEQKALYSKIINCDFFLMGTNAITMDGELINIDCRGNRVSFLCYGPENVIIITGMNKVTSDTESAIKRVHDIASPANAVRLNRKTPCATNGRCAKCLCQDTLCAQTIITRFSTVPNRIKVILVGEELGY